MNITINLDNSSYKLVTLLEMVDWFKYRKIEMVSGYKISIREEIEREITAKKTGNSESINKYIEDLEDDNEFIQRLCDIIVASNKTKLLSTYSRILDKGGVDKNKLQSKLVELPEMSEQERKSYNSYKEYITNPTSAKHNKAVRAFYMQFFTQDRNYTEDKSREKLEGIGNEYLNFLLSHLVNGKGFFEAINGIFFYYSTPEERQLTLINGNRGEVPANNFYVCSLIRDRVLNNLSKNVVRNIVKYLQSDHYIKNLERRRNTAENLKDDKSAISNIPELMECVFNDEFYKHPKIKQMVMEMKLSVR